MRLIAIIMSVIISFVSSSVCFADIKDNVKTYRFEDDIKMSGVISSSDKFFNIEKNWQIKNAKLNLVFTKSELLDVKYSTITVFINDAPVHSERLGGKREYKKETSIEIPKDLIKEGYNEIKIKAYKTISDMVCKDDSNTANWLVIHKDSNINVDYVYKKSLNLLSEYPTSYISTNNGLRLDTTILIPDNYSNSELTAGMILSSNFGQKIKHSDLNFGFNMYSDFKKKDDNVIYIGKENNMFTEVLNLLTEKEKSNLNDECVIKQVNSIFDKNKKMLIIISNNDDLLKNAAKLLSSKDLINNLNKDSIIIDERTDVNDLKIKENIRKVYLKDLGYKDIIVKGPFSQEAIMDINTPKDKVVGLGSKIKLNIRYADNLDFKKSLVTVYVNNIPIGSKKLAKEKSDNDIIELNLPKEVVEKNYYQIKVVFNLELLDLMCVTRDTGNPWAYISNESFIEFDYNDNNELRFKNYPYPFLLNNRFNNLTVVIPDSSSSKQLTYIANIIAYMGHEIKFNDGNLNIIKSSEFKNQNKQDNLIIIGTPSNNNLIKDINKNLNLKFKKDYKGFETDDKVKFIGEYSEEVGSIQLIDSPYSKNKSAMIIASTDIADLSLSSRYLSDLSLTKELKGDTIVIGRNGYVKNLDYKAKEQTYEDEIKDYTVISNQGKIFVGIGIFLLAVIITYLVVLILKYRKRI